MYRSINDKRRIEAMTFANNIVQEIIDKLLYNSITVEINDYNQKNFRLKLGRFYVKQDSNYSKELLSTIKASFQRFLDSTISLGLYLKIDQDFVSPLEYTLTDSCIRIAEEYENSIYLDIYIDSQQLLYFLDSHYNKEFNKIKFLIEINKIRMESNIDITYVDYILDDSYNIEINTSFNLFDVSQKAII